jgi:hypothetical protein
MLTDQLADRSSWVGLPEDRTTLMGGGPICRSFVWLGRHPVDVGVISAHVRFGISDNFVPAPDDPVRRALLYTLSVNQLAIAVYLPEVGGRERPDPPITQWVRLWPLRETVEFSTMVPVDQRSWARLLQDHRAWLPLTPRSAVRYSKNPGTASTNGGR